jgi:hypothetical protein
LRFTVKWTAIGAAAYWLLTSLVFGDESLDERSGVYAYRWSGLDALVNGEQFGFSMRQVATPVFDGVDGPYLVGERVFAVNAEKQLTQAPLDRSLPLEVAVGNADGDRFQVTLQARHAIQADSYPQPAKLIAISDIEGNFAALQSLLISNGVMNAQYEWTYGDGHVVFNGDFVDRGREVSQVLWLVYALEEKAQRHGGKVHFVLGNHEIMNMQGNASYAERKYTAVAQAISGLQRWDEATRRLYGADTEIGKWLRTKNVAEKIGPYVFVHGGLNREQVAAGLSIADLNRIARQHYGNTVPASASEKERIALSRYLSPYWDRSLAMSWFLRAAYLARDPFEAPTHGTTVAELDQVLAHFGARHVVIGHSIVSEVLSDYDGKVFKIDVKHGRSKRSAHAQGLLIEAGKVYQVNGLGEKVALRSQG